MKKLYVVLVAISFGFWGCNDDDGATTNQLSAEQGKAAMSNFSSDLAADIVQMTQADGMSAVGDMLDLSAMSDPFNGRYGEDEKAIWFKQKAQTFKNIFIPKALKNSRVEEGGFDFVSHIGIYEWNFDTNDFDKISSEGDVIILRFPTEGSTVNNAALTISDYREVMFEDDYEGQYYMPSAIEAVLYIDEVKQIALSFSIEYGDALIPLQGNLSLYVNPYTLAMSFDDTNASRSSGAFSLSNASELILTTEAQVNFASSSREDVKSLNATVTYRSMKMVGNVDVSGAEDAQEYNLNNYIDIVVYEDDAKVGEVIFVVETVNGLEKDVPYIKYADGSKERLKEAMAEAIAELEKIAEDLSSWG